MPAIPEATLHQWSNTGNKSQKVAAWLAAWAASQPPGTIVPADDVIIARFPDISTQTASPPPTTPPAPAAPSASSPSATSCTATAATATTTCPPPSPPCSDLASPRD